MRRTKLIVVIDVEIEDETSTQDMADLYSQALQTVDDNIVHNLVLYEHKENEETFSCLLDEIGSDFRHGDYRDW